MRVNCKIEAALLQNSCVDATFPISHGCWIVFTMHILSFPITGHGNWKFPAEATKNIRKWVILNRSHEGGKWQVFVKLGLFIRIENQVPGQERIIGRENHHD